MGLEARGPIRAPPSRATADRVAGARPPGGRRGGGCADRARPGRPGGLPAARARPPARAGARLAPGSGARASGLERSRIGGGPRRAAVRLPDAHAPVGGRGLRCGVRGTAPCPGRALVAGLCGAAIGSRDASPGASAAQRVRRKPRGAAWPRRSIPEPTFTATAPWTPLRARIWRRRCHRGPARSSTWAARAARRPRPCGRAASGCSSASSRMPRTRRPPPGSTTRCSRSASRTCAGILRAASTRSSSATCSSTSQTPPTPSSACGPGSRGRECSSRPCRTSATGPSWTI